MQIVAHGIDLVDCGQIDRLVHRHGGRFLNRVFTPAEQAYAGAGKNRTDRLAARFAAKEAVFKLIGTGWRENISWKDIEVKNDSFGRPEVKLTGRVKEIADKMKITQISLSITHTSSFAIASAAALAEAAPDPRRKL